MTRNESIAYILDRHERGLLTTEQATDRLDILRVRGGFEGNSFTGYDYHEQKWIQH